MKFSDHGDFRFRDALTGEFPDGALFAGDITVVLGVLAVAGVLFEISGVLARGDRTGRGLLAQTLPRRHAKALLALELTPVHILWETQTPFVDSEPGLALADLAVFQRRRDVDALAHVKIRNEVPEAVVESTGLVGVTIAVGVQVGVGGTDSDGTVNRAHLLAGARLDV